MKRVSAIVVGAGGFARYHMRRILEQPRATAIAGAVEPGEEQRRQTAALFAEHGRPCPPFYATLRELLAAQGPADAALIVSPHKYHLEHAEACLRAGMDVFLEKPMVMNAAEARRLIRTRDRTGRLLVVGFPGSLSPAVRKAKEMIRAGRLGQVSAISAFVHQQWKTGTRGKWRQVPEISGGGFLFDTGSHMVNTVVDLAGADVAEVMAVFDRRGAPVEINSSVTGRFRNGVIFSLCGMGDSIQCRSLVTVAGDAGVLRTGIWGERLEFLGAGDRDFAPVRVEKSHGAWDQFLKVRAGRLPNPCPAEVGMRFAKLMDLVRASAASGRAVRAR